MGVCYFESEGRIKGKDEKKRNETRGKEGEKGESGRGDSEGETCGERKVSDVSKGNGIQGRTG